MKLIIATLSVIFILLFSSFVYPSVAVDHVDAASKTKPSADDFCGSKCAVRCSKAGHDNCIKYCHICCQKCNCVPSGTFGNKHECPCYRDMRNSKGNPKCP
ncbi:unnamed protein product [Amaranthus hypochondriacus]